MRELWKRESMAMKRDLCFFLRFDSAKRPSPQKLDLLSALGLLHFQNQKLLSALGLVHFQNPKLLAGLAGLSSSIKLLSDRHPLLSSENKFWFSKRGRG